jgi:hypothetical protein
VIILQPEIVISWLLGGLAAGRDRRERGLILCCCAVDGRCSVAATREPTFPEVESLTG